VLVKLPQLLVAQRRLVRRLLVVAVLRWRKEFVRSCLVRTHDQQAGRILLAITEKCLVSRKLRRMLLDRNLL
jgi:hypothetical protein